MLTIITTLLYSEGLSIEENMTTNPYKGHLTDHVYPMIKYFYPDGRGVLQDYAALIHNAWTDDEDENDVALWPSHSLTRSQPNPITIFGRFWSDILDSALH